MNKKFFSLIVVPHHKGKSKTITLSEKKLRTLAGVFAFFFITLGVFFIDYFSMSGTRQKYKALTEENAVQKVTILKQKVLLNQLRTTVENLEDYADKINAMAGLKSPDGLKEVGVGGGARGNGQEMSFAANPQNLTINQAEIISQKAEGIEKNLNALLRVFEQQSITLANTPSVWPTTGWMSSGFGYRPDPFTGLRTFHYGVDIVSGYGNPVRATANGTVANVKTEWIGGKTIIISHGGGYSTVYCHLSKFNIKVGQKIKRHDVIGFVGNTGRRALGPHLHYEVRINGKAVDPLEYFLER